MFFFLNFSLGCFVIVDIFSYLDSGENLGRKKIGNFGSEKRWNWVAVC